LAGIPSVVYGFGFGYRALNSKSFGLPVGETALAEVWCLQSWLYLLLSLSQRTQCNTPRAMKEASLALGASIGKRFTRW
jgi:phosphate transport system permease protein